MNKITDTQRPGMSGGEWHRWFAAQAGPGLYRPDSYDAPAIDLADKETLAVLTNPTFLQGLENFTITHKPFENFIARLRHALLIAEKLHAKPAAAVACYVFNTEYILDAGEDEKAKVTALMQAKGAPELLGCYLPLHTLPNAAGIRKTLGDCALSRLQIDEPLAVSRRRETIEALTPIEAGVSAQVRAQYEESPYPRWRETPPKRFDADIRKLLTPAPDILVAGCGTGEETAQLALSWPEAKILAVDMSLSSLAYAAEQAERIGIRNVTFRHGDILNLDALPQRFDYISCQGVLHHMKDPQAGWRALREVLKPNGVMSIGLYSLSGRRHIIAAQEEIARRGFHTANDGIRAFRRAARDILPKDVLTDLEFHKDYYIFSMCRDMLFHVQEHLFDIPRIGKSLQALGLSFIKFNSPFTPPDGTTLDAWHRHEVRNPMIFRNMYKFWCGAIRGEN